MLLPSAGRPASFHPLYQDQEGPGAGDTVAGRNHRGHALGEPLGGGRESRSMTAAEPNGAASLGAPEVVGRRPCREVGLEWG